MTGAKPKVREMAAGLFESLKPEPPDPLLSLIAEFARDPRPGKIDLGVGVFRDDTGITPVMRAVKAAERELVATQASKSYLGPEGDVEFVALLRPIVFGGDFGERLVGVQTPGGTGAIRLAADLIAVTGARVWLGLPTWPNHRPVFGAAGVPVETYRHFDPATQSLCFDELMSALDRAAPGDVAVLHGCCHNPTGIDLSGAQWRAVAEVLAARGIVPLIDLAYQGLGEGLEEDAGGLREVLAHCDEALIAYSCDKNFGLYRDRVGALYALARGAAAAGTVYSNMLTRARETWSMPPDHGAAVARIVLATESLEADWRAELDTMRGRIRAIRGAAAAAHPSLAFLARQQGMFSVLPLDKAAIARLKAEHGIYMAASGRANLAGLRMADVPRFAAAVLSAMKAQAA
ncbi:MAG TPA: aromatic amino acid transaminase [Rhizomicrobium sp.]|nr:aromatic amino acid transaminase [Rhizomicrobium sp.]